MPSNQKEKIENLDRNFCKLRSGQCFDIEKLISILNKCCFNKQTISFIFVSLDHNETICCRANPKPCIDNLLTCMWCNDSIENVNLQNYKLHNLNVESNGKLFIVAPNLEYIDEENIIVSFPKNCIEVNIRRNIRYHCNSSQVHIENDNLSIFGTILDFTADSFCIKLNSSNSDSNIFLRPDGIVRTVITTKNNEVYRGDCVIVRNQVNNDQTIVVLQAASKNIPVQKPKKYRCERVKLIPSPYIRFQHEITKNVIILDVNEISGSGFSVQEDGMNSLLLPGMYIPSLELRFSNIYSIKCDAKVINRRRLDENEEKSNNYVCGFVFIDMHMEDHTKLVSYIHQAKDQRTLICNSPNMNSLWDFFFETGFVYPKKYKHIYSKQNIIKKNIEKIYIKNPETSRHFIFQDKGVINGLIALQRVYKLTWMMHHLAARKDALIAGPKVLSLIGSFINDSYNLKSNRMKYAIIYYRKENKFPNLVFGGVARKINNPQICSLDTFSYFHLYSSSNFYHALESPWKLTSCNLQDLEALRAFYMEISGGLMLKAFDLLPDCNDDNELSIAYKRSELSRERYLYTLKYLDKPIAIIMVHVTDIGINLSDLTNCIHVFLIKPKLIEKDIINKSLSYLAFKHYHGSAVVNLFPSIYLNELSIVPEKEYTLWTYEMQYSDYYYEHLKKLSRFLSIRE